jgi:replication factor C subunit 3/5
MSDFEDEMDVDAPVVDTSITFGGDSKKGKRSAANLPVEAEDSLPWYAANTDNVNTTTDNAKGRKIPTELAR